MLRRTIVLTGLFAVCAVFGAQAAVRPFEQDARASAQASPRAATGIQLAQSGDVEIYYDEFGRRIVRDAYTGEIISVERPRRLERRQQRRAERTEQERYYLDDPEDMRRLREQKLREGGFVPRSQDYGDYAPGEPGFYEEYPGDDYLGEPQRAFPDEPEYRQQYRQQAPSRVERRPLDASPAAPGDQPTPQNPAVAATPAVPGATNPDTTNPGTPNIVEGAIDPSLKLGAREEVAALQILLDRRGASPGVIDGRFGSNVDKAIVAYRSITNENLRSTDAEGIRKALAETGGDAFVDYTITAQDAAGPFVASVPADYGEKAKLDKMSYMSTAEMLAERFHMDEAYLKALNPQAAFNRPGTIIRVANVGKPAKNPVARIVADKSLKQVLVYDAANKLVAAYPATIGSTDTPSPSGTHLISRVVLDPDYTYNPNVNFKQGENNKILTIPPGPNGPVGNVWIALDKPTYGIHGTPDPSKIGKTESHGCVRLTNWDAQELAKLVKAGVAVEFVE
jgi:lipoprotein-anchoring transpeptidase ErfK/SrfK